MHLTHHRVARHAVATAVVREAGEVQRIHLRDDTPACQSCAARAACAVGSGERARPAPRRESFTALHCTALRWKTALVRAHLLVWSRRHLPFVVHQPRGAHRQPLRAALCGCQPLEEQQPVLLQVRRDVVSRQPRHAHQRQDLLRHRLCAIHAVAPAQRHAADDVDWRVG